MNTNPLKKDNTEDHLSTDTQEQWENSNLDDRSPEFDEIGTPLNAI